MCIWAYHDGGPRSTAFSGKLLLGTESIDYGEENYLIFGSLSGFFLCSLDASVYAKSLAYVHAHDLRGLYRFDREVRMVDGDCSRCASPFHRINQMAWNGDGPLVLT